MKINIMVYAGNKYLVYVVITLHGIDFPPQDGF